LNGKIRKISIKKRKEETSGVAEKKKKQEINQLKRKPRFFLN